MKLKDIKNSASRLIQNALQVFAVTCIYGYDMRKKHRELRYRLDTIRQKVQQTIIKDDIYHKMLDKVHPDWARLGRYDLVSICNCVSFTISWMSHFVSKENYAYHLQQSQQKKI